MTFRRSPFALLLAAVLGSAAAFAAPPAGENPPVEKPAKDDPRPKKKTLRDFSRRLGEDWLHAEQALPEKTPFMSNIRNPIGLISNDAKHNGTLAKEYHPGSRTVFTPGTLLVPYERAVVVGASVPAELVVTIDGQKYVTFFYHPSQKKYYASAKLPAGTLVYSATPSSSARSLFVLDEADHAFIAKTSLNDGVIGGFARRITVDEAMRSIHNSQRLKELHIRVKGQLPDSGLKWDLFEETAAVFPGDGDRGGFIFRKMPESLSKPGTTLLPMYSLIARPDGADPWIARLFADSGYASKADFVYDRFVKPMTELFSQLGFDAGITAQMHQQNLMVSVERGVDGKLQVTGLFLRDTEALFPVLSLQHHLGRANPPPDALLGLTEASRKLAGVFNAEDQIFLYKISASKFLQGYAEDMRYNSVRSVFKYFLNTKELDDVTIRMDEYFVKKMGQALPQEFAPKRISEMRAKFFAFDEEVLRRIGRSDILAERRIINPNTDFFVRNYEIWLNDLLNYKKVPSEKSSLCGFVLRKLPEQAIQALKGVK